jgi:hypothetical protein
MSNKVDGKEQALKQKEEYTPHPGKFLNQQDWEWMQRQSRSRKIRKRKQLFAVMVLLLWDGLLLYMIADCLIEPVCGAAFVAVISVYLGYQI